VDFECVECIDDADCPVAAPLCDGKRNKCGLCEEDTHRGCDAATPYCDKPEDPCVQCLDDNHCADNEKCKDGVCEPD